MSVRPSRLLVFAIVTVVLLGLEAKPLYDSSDVSEDFKLDNRMNEEPGHLMEEKRNKASLSTRILQKLSNQCPPNRFQFPWCNG